MRAISTVVKQTLIRHPELFMETKLEVGGSLSHPQFTVEHRADLNGRFEVMEGSAHRKLCCTLDEALQECLELNPKLILPQEIEVPKRSSR